MNEHDLCLQVLSDVLKELGSCDAFEDDKISGVHSGLNEELFTSCTLSGIRRDSIATMLCNHYNMSVLL